MLGQRMCATWFDGARSTYKALIATGSASAALKSGDGGG